MKWRMYVGRGWSMSENDRRAARAFADFRRRQFREFAYKWRRQNCETVVAMIYKGKYHDLRNIGGVFHEKDNWDCGDADGNRYVQESVADE